MPIKVAEDKARGGECKQRRASFIPFRLSAALFENGIY